MAKANANKPDDQGALYAGCSETAQTELLNECEEQFAQLVKLQNELVLSEQDLCENPQEQSVNRLLEVEAEMKQWMSVEPKLLATNPEISLNAGKKEMLRLCSELEMISSCCKAKRNKLRETKKCELKWLEKRRELLSAATAHADQLKIEREKLSEKTILQDIRNNIQKMRDYQNSLMETLGYVLDTHFPCIGDKKDTPHPLNENQISLNEILERLMNKAVETPHDPYVDIDETFWPPYVEMLLRYSVAVRHPENNFKMRLEIFD
ncbi:centromere protein K [Lampris incognitus]|uniref:centromere protein K n=1 Tax=Lampris incognitus TaxID=2546036 RepID=UPI0024B5052F|nr:centromere protein K [Lampris incognitus]